MRGLSKLHEAGALFSRAGVVGGYKAWDHTRADANAYSTLAGCSLLGSGLEGAGGWDAGGGSPP